MQQTKGVQSISSIIFDNSKDLRASIDDSYRTRRNYSSKGKTSIPTKARFKMQVYFLDGNKRYFYSFDYHQYDKSTILDEWLGFSALLSQKNEWIQKIKTVSIYANMDFEPLTNSSNYNVLAFRCFKNNRTGRIEVYENKGINFITRGSTTVLRIIS